MTEVLSAENGTAFTDDLIARLKAFAEQQPEKRALMFHRASPGDEQVLTYAELYRQVHDLGCALQREGAAGQVVVVAYPAGMAFVSAFLGVLAAGAIAVPASVGTWVTRKRAAPRLQHILDSSAAHFCLAPQAILEQLAEPLQREGLRLLSDEALRERPVTGLHLQPRNLQQPAYLQYSSGSTLAPKAVVISHLNLARNCAAGNRMMQYHNDSVSLCWMPHFHDYALANGICQPLYGGAEVHLMAPDSFLRRPRRWLELIDQWAVSHSGGPNFAWRYCVERLDAHALAGLDLSRWTYAHCAAEPIQQGVMEHFIEHFAACGFRREALHSCYGMAESVAFVTCANLGGDDAYRRVPGQPNAIVANCGRGDEQLQARIVDPATLQPCAPDEVGEVWLRHPSVGSGYWQLPALSSATFEAFSAQGDGPFLRTGDLGFMHEGDLFICGRLKDVLIVNGQNFYPQDLEALAQASDASLRADAGAAFQVAEEGAAARVVLVQEVAGRPSVADLDELATALRERASTALELQRLDEVVFIRSGSLDKTSSGKVMRQRTAARWREGSLQVLHQSALPRSARCPDAPLAAGVPDALERWLGVPLVHLESSASLLSQGLDSLNALGLQDDLLRLGAQSIAAHDLFGMTITQALQLPLTPGMANPEPLARETAEQSSFALSALQAAYVAGRSPAAVLGGIGCSYYQELRCPQPLDAQRLEQAWARLIERHACLRLVLDGEQSQRVLDVVPPYPIRSLALCDEGEREALRETLQTEVRTGRVWPLFDVRLSHTREHCHLHLWFDLLIIDAQGIQVLLTELQALYNNPACELPAISGSFREALEAGGGRRRMAVTAPLPGPDLALRISQAQIGTPRFKRAHTRLQPMTVHALERQALDAGVTLACVLLAALACVLRRWSQPGDFALTVTALERSVRPRDRLQPALGDYTRSLRVGLPDTGGVPFVERVQRLFAELTRCLSTPGSDLGDLHDSAGSGVPVVFTSLLGGDGEVLSGLRGMGQTVASLSMTPQVALDFQVWRDVQGLVLSLDHVPELFASGLPGLWLTTWQQALQDLAQADWAQPFAVPTPAAQLQRREPLDTWPVPSGLLYEAIEAQGQLTPQRLAVMASDGELRYDALLQQVSALQLQLEYEGVGIGHVVAIDLLKGWRQVVAVLAVLRAGAIYLPLERSWPWARVQGIVDRAPCHCVISDREAPAEAVVDQWLLYAAPLPAPAHWPAARRVSPDATAYLIYTSGSSGVPKGVAISHRSALNTVQDINRRFNVTADDRVLGVSSLAFDLSVYDLFGPLAVGGALLLPPAQANLDPALLDAFATEQGATVWNSVPALFQLQVERARLRRQGLPAALRLVLLSGDWIPLDLATRARELSPRLQVISLGGATEASIWSCFYPITEAVRGWPSVPYGVGLSQQSLQVLDPALEDCPDEVAGDLYIGGIGLAQGYWGDAARTAASFIVHPRSGQRLYRTGDRARYRANAQVEFLGRSDRQLKVGGYRIEPGEIEAALLGCADVSRCTVLAMAWVEGAGQQLVAFVCRSGVDIAHQVPRDPWVQRLAGTLPGYMLPSRFIELPHLPLSANGKVDPEQLRQLARDLEAGSQPVAHAPVDAALPWLDEWLQQRLGTAPLPQDTSLIGLGLTSLDILGLATELERASGLNVRAAQLVRLENLAQLRALLATATPRHDAPSSLALSEEQRWIEQTLAHQPVLHDRDARQHFTRRQQWARLAEAPSDSEVVLAADAFRAEPFARRASCRTFAAQPCSLAQLAGCLSAARLACLDGRPVARWASASGCYPLELYAWARPGGVSGLSAGLFRYDPVSHRLQRLAGEQPQIERLTLANRALLEQAGVLLLIVADLSRTLALYGRDAWRFSLMEAGAASHELELAAHTSGLASCQLGDVDFAPLSTALHLGNGRFGVHALVLGSAPPQGIAARQSGLRSAFGAVVEGEL